MKQRSRKQIQKPDYYSQREWNRIVEREKVQKKQSRSLLLLMLALLAFVAVMIYAAWFFILRSHDIHLILPYNEKHPIFGMYEQGESVVRATPFADGLCVTDRDVNADSIFITATEGALFDVNKENVLYAKDIFEQRSPASITKVMTALVALKYGNMDDMVTVSQSAFDIDPNSSVCMLKLGDRLTLKQLLYGMLIASGNDAAQMVAEYIGNGSISNFVDMMNREALSLGATHTHFANAHGLTAENHYTCGYDIYLMMNACMKYDLFMDIIQRKNYYAEYTDANGNPSAVTWDSTNYYHTGDARAPSHVIVYGGKTGTTDDAGACLALISKDLYGNPFISVILHSETKDSLYSDMNQILSLVPA